MLGAGCNHYTLLLCGHGPRHRLDLPEVQEVAQDRNQHLQDLWQHPQAPNEPERVQGEDGLETGSVRQAAGRGGSLARTAIVASGDYHFVIITSG